MDWGLDPTARFALVPSEMTQLRTVAGGCPRSASPACGPPSPRPPHTQPFPRTHAAPDGDRSLPNSRLTPPDAPPLEAPMPHNPKVRIDCTASCPPPTQPSLVFHMSEVPWATSQPSQDRHPARSLPAPSVDATSRLHLKSVTSPPQPDSFPRHWSLPSILAAS